MEAFNRELLQFFDKLLWISIQSSVLIVLIVLLQKVLRGKLGIRWHYFLWGLLLIRLAIPWLPESKISIFNLFPKSIQQGRIIESISKHQDDRYMGRYLYAESADVQEVPPEGDSKTVFAGFVRILPVLWLTGVLIMSVYICVRNISLWLTVKRERPITDQEILDLLEDCKMEMGVQTIIGVVVSDRIKSPALFGFVRPRLLLPQGMLETYGLDELRYVFIHELAHLKQRDIYFGWLIALLQIAHWFNPLMWLAFRRMRADRELACDGLAISMIGENEPPRYGQTIVNLLENFSQIRYVPSVAGILEDKSQIERRIKMIADYKKTSRSRWAGAMLLLAVFACVVLTNAYMAQADFIFGEPTNLGSVINSPDADCAPCLSGDGLELYFHRGEDVTKIWVARRATPDSEWGLPTKLGSPINTADSGTPFITSNGLMLFMDSSRPGGSGSWDLWVASRATVEDDWGTLTNLGASVNSASEDWGASLSADGLELYFTSGQYGSYDLWMTTRATIDDNWGPRVNLGPTLNTSVNESFPSISADGLSLFFASNRPGGYGSGLGLWDLYVARRATTNDPWDPPMNLGPTVNSSYVETGGRISADGSTLYFHSNRPGGFGWDLWQARILPVVDFNADGIVDGLDICLMVDNWHTDEPLYDIAPMPFGDGIVDVKDLVLLSEHLTPKEVEPNEPVLP